MTLEELRVAKNMSQQQLARATGLTQGYISALERGAKKNPGQIVVKKLAIALEISTDVILGLFPDTFVDGVKKSK
ncbi:helix-turn-helix domain-containing protein [Sporomusa acidovorans]|uniref:HTH cro/C1-type domain-containing protein n=1 Tax=Sporomusa acidovorans (strain ATCC 49682 / DSM 3132 / Mol) TaxID=1123286 RepID=A0ABZ3IWC0_SPOA4|nr:helix-turn-helix transcriptional regulator [Sporomusa acidovorans]OZC22032.1 helix-turn-helix protein [Sporomusa acidovorans DSM 3132]SDF70030.1 Helix-turn-helix [Sporomusa acidovorans]